MRAFQKLIGGTELENCFNLNIHVFEAAFRLTLVQQNRQKSRRIVRMEQFFLTSVTRKAASKA